MAEEDLLKQSVEDFIASAAAKTPTPGGGSVAGVVGALAAALGEMALNFTRGKKKYAQHAEAHDHLAGRLERAREIFCRLVADDVAAYRLYQATSRQEDSPEKDAAVQVAVAAAVNVPREVAKLALALLEDLKAFQPTCNPWLITDLLAGGALAVAASRLSDYNVRINLPQVSDRQAAEEIARASAADLAKAEGLLAELEAAAREHLG
jgi:formiminotetrahydrofolate cyclodeaminase